MFKEDQETELKLEINKDIKKEIVAFANTNNGTIYIGINDNGEVIGLKNASKDLEALSGMIREGIKSDLTLYTKIYIEKIDNKDIIIVKINEAPNKPYYLADKGLKTSGVYLRHGNVSVPASEEIIKKMLLDNTSTSFENTISNIQDLHFEYLQNIFNKHDLTLNESKLKALNVMNLNCEYTNLGLLLSDECPYSIKCAIFNGNNKLEFRDRKEFTGCIIKQVNDAFEYLQLYNKTKSEFKGLERIDTCDYPEYAIRESLLNAVIHRDYNFTGSILISLFDNHIEIASLGGLLKGLTLEDLYNGVSETRNPNLANIFYRLNYVESFGTGIERIFKSYDGINKKPVISNTENVFKITLFNANYIESEEKIAIQIIQNEYNKIIEYIQKNGKITRAMAEKILNVSKTKATHILLDMLNENILMQIGTGRNICYLLKE